MKFYFFIILNSCLIYGQHDDILLNIDNKLLKNDSINNLDVFIEKYENGLIKISGQKKGAKREGIWFYYDFNGRLTHESIYKNDKLIYHKFFGHKNGLFFQIVNDSL